MSAPIEHPRGERRPFGIPAAEPRVAAKAGLVIAAVVAVVVPTLTGLAPGDVLGAGPVAPQPVWTVRVPGYKGVGLGPVGGRALALFFTDQPSWAVPARLSLRVIDTQTGAAVWTTDELTPHDVTGAAGDAERLYLLSDRTGRLAALAWATGRPLWTSHAYGGLLAQDGRVAWMPSPGHLVLADGATGRPMWQRDLPGSNWTLQTFALGNLYVLGAGAGRDPSSCSSLALAIDELTGATVREAVLNPDLGCQYVLDYLRWSARLQLFYAQDGLRGAGVNSRDVRVVKQDLSPLWNRSDIRDCVAIEDVLVCETYHRLGLGPWSSSGPIGIDLATGRTLWQVPEPEDITHAEKVIGPWNGNVIVMRHPREGSPGSLSALRPRDGGAVWSLTASFEAASVYGNLLFAAVEPQGEPAVAIAYRLP